MTDYSRIYKEVFAIDGSLRDIYILGTNEQDWQMLLDFLRLETCPIECTVGGELCPLPERIEHVFALTKDDYTPTLHIDKTHLALNCHFFTREEIEFDLDPGDFQNEQQISRLLNFIRQVGRLLNKVVVLKPENSPDCPCPYLRFEPQTDMVEWSDNENNIFIL